MMLAPDAHSAYGELVQKYFVSQGLASGQDVCLVREDARQFVEGCMWMPAGSTATATNEKEQDEKAEEGEGGGGGGEVMRSAIKGSIVPVLCRRSFET